MEACVGTDHWAQVTLPTLDACALVPQPPGEPASVVGGGPGVVEPNVQWSTYPHTVLGYVCTYLLLRMYKVCMLDVWMQLVNSRRLPFAIQVSGIYGVAKG
jgi:hypothetical protein